ncbi:MAG: CAAD domain-containing protein [Pleurocapsa sp. MO_226.B13]|nr:CAAD domain-containing protein [Pleurocapsa sp. MO_226.B13]
MEANTPEVTETQATTTSISSESPGTITATTPKPSPADTQVQEYLNIGTNFLSKLFDYLKEFVDQNQKLLVNLLLIFLGIIAVKITLAVVAAINDIPLLAPMFELVGLGYTVWFVYRYLLTKSSRQELVQEFESLRTQVVGKE